MVLFTLILSIWRGSLQSVVPPKELLAEPTGMFACHLLEPTTADSADVLLDITESSNQIRESIVGYRSNGEPLYMTVQMRTPLDARTVIHGAALRFGVGGKYIRAPEPRADARIGPDQVQSASLTSAEMARGEAVAKWFWTHRCK